MIKLTCQSLDGRPALIRLEGRLDAPAAEQLDSCIAGLPVRPATIDLTGVRSIDASGCGVLHRLRESGHRLVGGSLYIRQLLEEARA